MAVVKFLIREATEGVVQPQETTDSIQVGGVEITGGGDITGLPTTPPTSTSAASKAYVDSVAQGLDTKESVRVATVPADSSKVLATDFEEGDSIDNVTLVAGDRILIKDLSTGSQNGIYIVEETGAPTRADDLPAGDGAAGAYMFVEEGDTNADTGWVCTNNDGSDVVGTDALVFVKFTGTGSITAGDGLDKSGDTIFVDLSASNPGLELTGTSPNKTLQVLVDGDHGIIRGASGLELELVSADRLSVGASGLDVVGLPSQFKINGTNVSVNVTAANLDTLTSGQTYDASSLHNHDTVRGHYTNASEVTAYRAVKWSSTASKIEHADKNSLAGGRVIGVARVGGAADATSEVIREGICAGALAGGGTVNTPYFLGDSGAIIAYASVPVGDRLIRLGFGVNTNDLDIKISDLGVK